jgi:hypothetical protein
MELSCVRWSNAAMRCRYAATRALQFRLPASMAACAWAIPSSTTGIAGAPVWHSPPCWRSRRVMPTGPVLSGGLLLAALWCCGGANDLASDCVAAWAAF